jgi:hypothetical protein
MRAWTSTGSQREPQSFSPTVTTCSATPGASSSTPAGDNDGFASPEAAAEWARTQTVWEYRSELDFSDGCTAQIVLGSEFNANQAVWEAWDGGDLPDAPGVHNYAEDLGLVADPRRPGSTGSCSTG